MSTQTILPIDRQSVTERSQASREPEWMTAVRLKGLELAGTLELPKLEKTRIDRWNLEAYGTYRAPGRLNGTEELPEAVRSLAGDSAQGNQLIQKDSGTVWARVSAELASQGVIFTDLETAIREHGDLVQKYFLKAVAQDENKLTALHSAVWNGGIFVYVPKNVTVELPLQALFVSEEANASFAPHVLLVAEANSSVTYVDNFVTAGNAESLVASSIVEVFVKPGAKVRFASVHNMSMNVTDLSYRRAVVENDGSMEWIIGEMNAGNGMSDTTSLLKGDGSFSDMKVICVGNGEQKLNLTTRNVHFGKMSSSDMITRAVMRESATAIINGVTKIEKGATGANGQQTEKVLMLSPGARGDANPILLIDEDDVKAGHAASVGQVNPDQVYYLMSRGISKEEAERLIIYGFLAPVVSEIPLPQLEEQFQRLVERKLGQ
ncbi:Fe-S cluster assembly protein SufD [Paenibacillus sp. CC-CFT747]|nr:Fe-S cluster assembly protein SufD [Paenibacillus sp. CC-CFT747]